MNHVALKPTKSVGGNCFDDVIATLDTLYQRGYKLMYANALKFEWAPPSPGATFGNRLYIGLSENHAMLGKFHGYTGHFHRRLSVEKGLPIVMEQIGKGQPVIVNIDTYYCPWDIHYQKHHFFLHVILITGTDPVTGDFVVVDPFFQLQDLRLTRQQFIDGLLGLTTLEPIPGWRMDREQTIANISSSLRSHLDRSTDHFQRFAEEIRHIDFELESVDGDSRFMASSLYLKLGSVQVARINYATLLEYLAETFNLPSLAACCVEVRRLGNPWGSLAGTLAKMSFMTPERREEKLMNGLKDRVLAAVESERQVLQRLLSVLDGQHQTPVVQVDDSPRQTESSQRIVVPVDIKNICNIRGIENKQGTADVDGDGHCFARVGLPADGQLRVGDISFIFPAANNDTDNDNVSCYGQSIPLVPDRYAGIAVLASGQYGGCADMFTIAYEDGSTEQVQLGFADSWTTMPIAGETIAWSAPMVNTDTGKQTNLTIHLFANEACLKRKDAVAVRLVLPTMPNMHVYGISMWKHA